jgi:hypothetical protein
MLADLNDAPHLEAGAPLFHHIGKGWMQSATAAVAGVGWWLGRTLLYHVADGVTKYR